MAGVGEFPGAIDIRVLDDHLNVLRGVVQGAQECNIVSGGGIIDKARREGFLWVDMAHSMSPWVGKGPTCCVP